MCSFGAGLLPSFARTSVGGHVSSSAMERIDCSSDGIGSP